MESIKSILTILCVMYYFPAYNAEVVPKDSTQLNQTSFRVGYGHMHALASHSFLIDDNKQGIRVSQARNVAAEFLIQTHGKREWNQLYNFPKIGLGIQYLWFPQTTELGAPHAIYGIFEAPIHRWEKAQLDWAFHFGVATGWNEYDTITNFHNKLIGTNTTLYAHLGIRYKQYLGNRINLEGSLGLSHASNGAVKMPNYGINLFDPRISLTYNFQNHRPTFHTKKLQSFNPKNEISLAYARGTKQVDITGSSEENKALFTRTSFDLYNVVLLYQREISRKSKLGAGLDFTVDPSDNLHGYIMGDTNAIYPAPFKEKAKLALVLSYELSIGKLSFVLQPGVYIYRTPYAPNPLFYQRIGTRYNLYKGLFVGASLRAINFGVADWVEVTLGYKLKW